MTHVDDDDFITTVKQAVAKHNSGTYGDLEDLQRRVREFHLEGQKAWRERFIAWDTAEDGTRYGMYDEGDEFAPFFSEAFLYNLVGKDEARSILGIMRSALALAGATERVV